MTLMMMMNKVMMLIMLFTVINDDDEGNNNISNDELCSYNMMIIANATQCTRIQRIWMNEIWKSDNRSANLTLHKML